MIDPQTRHNIRKIREIKGYSQYYMAIELEVSSKSYSRIECGKTGLSISRLKNIAEILGLSAGEIIDFDSKNIFLKKNG